MPSSWSRTYVLSGGRSTEPTSAHSTYRAQSSVRRIDLHLVHVIEHVTGQIVKQEVQPMRLAEQAISRLDCRAR